MLEANAEIGGATTSARAFPDFDAHLSRYSIGWFLLMDIFCFDDNSFPLIK
jgi:hypothetical protein